MSKQNKVNKSNYDQRGRLTPDEMARERMKQARVSGRPRVEPFKEKAGARPPIQQPMIGESESTRRQTEPEE